jgi:hypothetical protein
MAGGMQEDILGRLDTDSRFALLSGVLQDLLAGTPSPWMEMLMGEAQTAKGAIKGRAQEKESELHGALSQRGGGDIMGTIMASNIVPRAEREGLGLQSEALKTGQQMTMGQLGGLQSFLSGDINARMQAWLPAIQAQQARAANEANIFGQIMGGAMQGLGSAFS